MDSTRGSETLFVLLFNVLDVNNDVFALLNSSSWHRFAFSCLKEVDGQPKTRLKLMILWWIAVGCCEWTLHGVEREVKLVQLINMKIGLTNHNWELFAVLSDYRSPQNWVKPINNFNTSMDHMRFVLARNIEAGLTIMICFEKSRRARDRAIRTSIVFHCCARGAIVSCEAPMKIIAYGSLTVPAQLISIPCHSKNFFGSSLDTSEY